MWTRAMSAKPSFLPSTMARYPVMKPRFSSARTRRRHGDGERPMRSARSWLASRPSRCRCSRIWRSKRSSAAWVGMTWPPGRVLWQSLPPLQGSLHECCYRPGQALPLRKRLPSRRPYLPAAMIEHAAGKYRPFRPVALADRRWPSQVTTQAPVWMSTDLRDGNQALFEPMSVEKKLRLFKTLCAVGFKEIEVAFPSASQTDFDFVRLLVEGGHVPDDVTLVVLTQAREHLIRRTMEAIRGAPRAVVHVYAATAPTFREVVFRLTKDEVVAMAVEAVRLIRALAADLPGTDVRLEYSPEVFSGTELEFSKRICDAVVEAAGATPERKIILNLPATVEMASPNVYADQIEWMHRNLEIGRAHV